MSTLILESTLVQSLSSEQLEQVFYIPTYYGVPAVWTYEGTKGMLCERSRANIEGVFKYFPPGEIDILELKEYEAAVMASQLGYKYLLVMDMSGGPYAYKTWPVVDVIPVS